MNIVERAAGFSGHHLGKQVLVFLLSLAILIATCPQNLSASQGEPAPAQTPQGAPYATQTPEQLQRLVAPIALYSDSLVAQILAASTFPEQVVEADRWVQAHSDLKGDVSMANCYFAKPHGMQHCYIPFFMLLISNALLVLARHSQ
jgi:hypothetical protein